MLECCCAPVNQDKSGVNAVQKAIINSQFLANPINLFEPPTLQSTTHHLQPQRRTMVVKNLALLTPLLALVLPHPVLSSQGVTVSPNLDVFLKKVQTALALPPSLFGNFIALFSLVYVNLHKFAMNFFGLEIPPPLPPFWTYFLKFTTKIYRFAGWHNLRGVLTS